MSFYKYIVMNFVKTKLRNLANTIKSSVDKCNDKFIKRRNKDKLKQLEFKDVVFTSAHLVNTSSYSISNSFLKLCSHKNISNQAINKRRENMDPSLLDVMNNDILDNIYTVHGNTKYEKGRRIAVDGSQINLNKKLNEDGFKLSSNNEYCVAKLGSLYDVDKRTSINYTLSKSLNEREILISQLKYVNSGDILIMDGGYYSEELISTLIEQNINFIFRMSSSNLFVKNYISDNTIFDVRINNITTKCKIIKQTKENNNDRYLMTNLTHKSSTSIKNDYGSRWDVEVDFRKVKYDVLYNNIRSKREPQVMIDIQILNFVSLVLSQIENICKVEKNLKINSKNTISLFYSELLKYFLYKNMTAENLMFICRILNIIATTTEPIRKGRHYKRIRKKPSTKWNINGNRYRAK